MKRTLIYQVLSFSSKLAHTLIGYSTKSQKSLKPSPSILSISRVFLSDFPPQEPTTLSISVSLFPRILKF